MILCNRFELKQQYNVNAIKTPKNRIDLQPTKSMTEVEISLFSMKQEDFRHIFQKAKFKEPIEVMYDHKMYTINPYDLTVQADEHNYNISQVVINGYVEQDETPEFEIID